MNAQDAAAARPRAIPLLRLSRQEAADALGVSIDFFDEHAAHASIATTRRPKAFAY